MTLEIKYSSSRSILITDLEDYTITIDSTPIDSADSSGSVGTFNATFPRPMDSTGDLNFHSPLLLVGKDVILETVHGTLAGIIDNVSLRDHNMISVECTSYAGPLNAYRVKAKPMHGNVAYTWLGAAHLSESTLRVDGTEIARNLVRNPSFEADLSFVSSGTGVSNTRVANTLTSFGSRMMRSIVSTSGSAETDVWQEVAIPSGNTGKYLNFSLNVGSVPSNVTVWPYIEFYSSTGRLLREYLFEHRNSSNLSDLPRVGGSYSIPSGATSSRVGIFLRGTSVSTPPPLNTAVDTDGWSAYISSTPGTFNRPFFDGSFANGEGPVDLGAALKYYFSLATSTVGLVVEEIVAYRPVVYPGWTGELWYHLKMLCAAEDVQFVLSGDNVVRVEPNVIREFEHLPIISEDENVNSSQTAQSIEVYEYNSEPVRNVLFYPAGGWSEDVEILSVNAGEYTEQTIELGGTISSFQAPTMQTFVSREHQSSSVYTIVGDDGFVIQPAQWRDNGGEVTFEIGEDSDTMVVKMRGATNIRMSDGTTSTSFSLALAADTNSGSRYSTLRIVGTGVRYHKEILNVATGIDPDLTGTEVGVTVDNPFLFDRERVGRAASLASAAYAGATLTASLSLSWVGEGFRTTDVGARFQLDGRMYRMRSLNYSATEVSASADAHTTYRDYKDANDNLTYGDVELISRDLNYRDVELRGTRLFRAYQ